MPAVSASWLVGSITLPDAAIVFDGDDVLLDSDTYYLRHATSSLSLVDYLNTQIDGGPSAITCTSLVVLQNRLVQINLSGVTDISWTTNGANAGDWAAALGFDGSDLTGAASYTASYPSPLLFSSGYPLTPTTISGVSGYTVSHQSRYKADDGTQIYVAHYGDETWQELRTPHVVPSRMRVTGTTLAQGGTFHQFYEQVLKYGRRFLHYETITEDSSSTSAVTWTTALGPYAVREADGNWYRRNVPSAEVSSPLELPISLLAEIT
jgi:hypothetical protein